MRADNPLERQRAQWLFCIFVESMRNDTRETVTYYQLIHNFNYDRREIH